jgi:hypothetical protein
MRVVSTLIVRDEADIVGEHLRYHADQGVDFVVAIDHRSEDGTTDVLREHERAGRLHLIREQGDVIRQQEWVTRMARLAATDFGADWVLNCDVDEFWWPREGSLRDVLEAVPARFGTVRGWGRHFVARPETGAPFSERMTVRRRPTDQRGSPYRPGFKTAHRATPDVVVTRGNHNAFGRGLTPLRDWKPCEVFHFPIRAQAQMERKFIRLERSLGDHPGSRHERDTARAIQAKSGAEVFSEFLVDDRALAAGLRDGSLEEDTRLRDALRDPVASRPRPTLADDVSLALDFADFHPSDSTVRLERRIEELRGRLELLER